MTAVRLVAILLTLAWAWLAPPAGAQDTGPQPQVALFADAITYDPATGVLTARGNVEAWYGPVQLTAPEIRFEDSTGRLTATGPLKIDSGEGPVFLADMAELSPDFRNGLIRGARLILDERVQIAAAEAERSDGRFNTLYKTVASSCTICADNPTPIWRIRALKIVHDEMRERVYFENAFVDVFGFPVAYLPRLRVPAPGVERATGFLPPTFSNSSRYGASVRLPYYVTLGDHADFTFTPFLSTDGPVILQGEYRRQVGAGGFVLDGAISFGDDRDDSIRGFLNAAGSYRLPAGFNLDHDIRLASDKSFLDEFNFSSEDRLQSVVSLNRYRSHDYTDIRIEGYQTLRASEDQDTIPVVLPRIDYRRIWPAGPFGGRMGVSAGAMNLFREDGRDVLRLSGGMDWRLDGTLANGMQVAAIADIGAEVYSVSDDTSITDIESRITPTLGAEWRWPLARYGTSATHVIEPVVQVFYGRTLGDENVPNEDSLLPELDETNLFSINRFPGVDGRETGFRLNYGVNYTRYDPAGWNMGFTIGQVLKREPDPNFPEGTGLTTRRSDYVIAGSLDLPPAFSLVGRGLFGPSFDFRRGSLDLRYDTERFGTGFNYTFLAADGSNPVLGFVPKREEVTMTSRYRFRPNWRFDAEWRYDLATSSSVEGSAGVTYGNECLEVALSLSRSFTTSNNVDPGSEVSLKVNLLGFGGARDNEWPERQCRG